MKVSIIVYGFTVVAEFSAASRCAMSAERGGDLYIETISDAAGVPVSDETFTQLSDDSGFYFLAFEKAEEKYFAREFVSC